MNNNEENKTPHIDTQLEKQEIDGQKVMGGGAYDLNGNEITGTVNPTDFGNPVNAVMSDPFGMPNPDTEVLATGSPVPPAGGMNPEIIDFPPTDPALK